MEYIKDELLVTGAYLTDHDHLFYTECRCERGLIYDSVDKRYVNCKACKTKHRNELVHLGYLKVKSIIVSGHGVKIMTLIHDNKAFIENFKENIKDWKKETDRKENRRITKWNETATSWLDKRIQPKTEEQIEHDAENTKFTIDRSRWRVATKEEKKAGKIFAVDSPPVCLDEEKQKNISATVVLDFIETDNHFEKTGIILGPFEKSEYISFSKREDAQQYLLTLYGATIKEYWKA
jgi:hypothetical protein